MADILIKNGTVIAIDPERRIIADGAVAITGDRIVAVGPTAEVEAAHPAREVIDARGMAIMPGFVDAHAHAGHGLIKTLGGGKSDPWYQACRGAYTVGSTPEFWFAEAQLAALERLRFGQGLRRFDLPPRSAEQVRHERHRHLRGVQAVDAGPARRV